MALPSPRTSYLIGRADRLLRSKLEQQFSDGPLSLHEFTVLSVLTTRPRLSNADLARRSFVSPQAMHKVVKSLEESGLITRDPSPSGGRSLETTITAKGKTTMAEAEIPMSEAEDAFLDPLNPKEQTELRRLLRKLGSER